MRRVVPKLLYTLDNTCGRSSLPTSFKNPHLTTSWSASFFCSLHSTQNGSLQFPRAAGSNASLPSHRCTGHALSWRSPDLVDSLDIFLVARSSLQFSGTGPRQPLSKLQILRNNSYSRSISLNAARDPAQPPEKILSRNTSMPLEDVIRSSAGIDATPTEKQLNSRAKFQYTVCSEHGCNILASFNWPGVKHQRFCSEHKLLGMVIVVKKLCEGMGCSIAPVYNVEGSSKGRFCVKHMYPGMVNVKSPRCEEAMCSTQPNFNTEGSARGRFCFSHKRSGMVNVMSAHCEAELCRIQPSYNTVGAARRRFCRKHMLLGMVDVTAKLCKHHLCMRIPSFNTHGETTGRFCKKHMQPGMVDVVSKLCEGDGCSKYPSFGVPGTSQRRYCALHKLPGMVCLIAKKKPSGSQST